MPVRFSVVLVAAAIALPPRAVVAQGGGQGAPLQNLQYFPKDISRDSLTQFMRGFAMSLGVRCEFCHVAREGAPPNPGGAPPLNYASDEKDNKKIARYM